MRKDHGLNLHKEDQEKLKGIIDSVNYLKPNYTVEDLKQMDIIIKQGARKSDPRYYSPAEEIKPQIKTKEEFYEILDQYSFSSDTARDKFTFTVLETAIEYGNRKLVEGIYDDVEYSKAHEKFDNEIRTPNSHDPHPTSRKNQQEKAVNVLRSIPEKGGNDEKRESITEDQKQGREGVLEHIVTKTFFRDGKNAESGLDLQFTRVNDFQDIYDKAGPSFQEEIKIALKASLEKSLSGEYEKIYHVNGVSRTSDGKQAHPIEKFTQLAKEIGVDLKGAAYTKALFDGKGKEVEGTSVRIDPGHNAYLYLIGGGKLDKTEISNPDNKEIVEKAFDRYLLQDRKLGIIEKATICARNEQWGKLLYSVVPDALKSSTDKTSKGELPKDGEKPKQMQVSSKSALKAPADPETPALDRLVSSRDKE